jgi:ABC-type Mn2+/Zn2+ transport system permease subunit
MGELLGALVGYYLAGKLTYSGMYICMILINIMGWIGSESECNKNSAN